MALTRDFKITVIERAKSDKKFREKMLSEAVNELLNGDVDAGKAMLRDYINATITFESLAKSLEKNPKSLMRMLSPSGNPTSKSLFSVFHVIQEIENIHFEVAIV